MEERGERDALLRADAEEERHDLVDLLSLTSPPVNTNPFLQPQ